MSEQEFSDQMVSQVEAGEPGAGDKAQQEGLDAGGLSGRLDSSHFVGVFHQLLVQGPLAPEDLPLFVLEMMPVALPLSLAEVSPEGASWPKLAQLAMAMGFAAGFMSGAASADPKLALRPREVTTLGLVTGSAAYHYLGQTLVPAPAADEDVHRADVPAQAG